MIGCVVLTTGRKPDDLRAALDSLARQRGVEVDVAVVGNGWRPEGLPPTVTAVHEPVDRGIPAGRNAGVPHVRGELLLFLDHDAALVGEDALARVAAAFAADPALGAAQLRVVAREGGPGRRDWVPRLRASNQRPGDVTVLWEGAVAIRRALFERVGGWWEPLRFVHEGVDLAWKVLDTGYRVGYLAGVAVTHPSTAGAQYPRYYSARNRTWLARRYLPWPLGALYVGAFALRTLPRMASPERREALRGYRDGVREPFGERRRLQGRTLVRMARAGRPPIM
jgi:GT2 family glycosyltransferase